MRIIAEMENKFGGYSIPRYEVRVFRDKGEVFVIFENANNDPSAQKGGSIWMPPNIANRLGHALLLASNGEEEGLQNGITFSVNEQPV